MHIKQLQTHTVLELSYKIVRSHSRTSRHVPGREKKTRVMKHMVMQAIGHYREPCNWPKKQWRDPKVSSYEVARQNH